MIENDQQYEVSKWQIQRLITVLEISKTGKKNMPKEIYEAMIAGIESQIKDIEIELNEYKECDY